MTSTATVPAWLKTLATNRQSAPTVPRAVDFAQVKPWKLAEAMVSINCQSKLTFRKCSGSTPVASNTCYNLYSNCADLCRFDQSHAIDWWWMLAVKDILPITNKSTYAGKTKVVPLVVCWVINVCSHRDSAILLVKPTSWTIFFSYFADDKCKKACGKCWRKPSLTFWPKEDKTRPLRISFEYNPVLI